VGVAEFREFRRQQRDAAGPLDPPLGVLEIQRHLAAPRRVVDLPARPQLPVEVADVREDEGRVTGVGRRSV
jgi:hypothetical protein